MRRKTSASAGRQNRKVSRRFRASRAATRKSARRFRSRVLKKRSRKSRQQLQGGMRLYVNSPSGNIHVLNLEPTALVGELKPLLEEAEGISAREQSLTFGGAPLLDTATLADSGLGDDSTLSLAFNPIFVMPMNARGDPDFGRPILGDLAAWRAANPHALVADISGREDLTDADFVHLRGIRALDMSYCTNAEITDAAFANLRGIHTLSMMNCNQFTDAAFVHLAGIHTLIMIDCESLAITELAFAYISGIHTLHIQYCNQPTISDAAFAHLGSIHYLNMYGCNQETITDAAFAHLKHIHELVMTSCDQPTITDRTLAHLLENHVSIVHIERCPQFSHRAKQFLRDNNVIVYS
jgi:hypothetical protein